MSDISGQPFLSFRNRNSHVLVEEGTKMNETEAHVTPNVIGFIRRSEHYLLKQEIVLNSCMYFDRAYPGSGAGPGHCLSKKD